MEIFARRDVLYKSRSDFRVRAIWFSSCLDYTEYIGNRYSPMVIVAPITASSKAKLPAHYCLRIGQKVKEPSVVLLEQLWTLDKHRLKRYIGKLKKSSMDEVDRVLAISVGLSKFLCYKKASDQNDNLK